MLSSASADRILLLEDEPAIAEVLGIYLRDEGFIVRDGSINSVLERALSHRPTLVILDLALPARAGSDAFGRLRQTNGVPIIVLTSWLNEADRVAGRKLGADDYIGKPFSPRDVVARVKAVLRRSQPPGDDQRLPERRVQCIGSLEIDRAAHEVRRRGMAVLLTPTEFRILEALATHLGQVLSREQLIERTARDADIYDRTLDRHVGNLRQKIEDDPQNPVYILTVQTIGYKMVESR